MWKHSKLKLPIIILTVGITLLIWLWYVSFHMPTLLADTGYIYIFGKVASLIAAAVIASTMSLLVFLAKTNPRQLTSVIRFSRARLIDAVLLWILIPTALFYYLPTSNLHHAYRFQQEVYRSYIGYLNYNLTISSALIQLGLFITLFAGCYVSSSIIISCIKRRLIRLAAFLLVSFAAYMSTLLWLGVQPAF